MVAVTLAVIDNCHGVHKNEKEVCAACLGCKRSLVQIQSRRPIYLTDLTQVFTLKRLSSENSKNAYTCSKTKAKEQDSGGKIGVRHELRHLVTGEANSHRSFPILSSAISFSNLITSLTDTGGLQHALV